MDNVKGVGAGAMLFVVLSMTSVLVSAGKPWSSGHQDHLNHIDVTGPHPKSKVENLEVVCSRDHMTIHMHFDQPFYGMVFSQGSREERCVHVGPRAGIQSTSFQIRYDTCGTVEDLGGRFHENTIVIQFGEDILEAWDEAKRLRCEWLESFEKPSSKPTLAISDLDVVELNFQGDDIDCWMEVQEGKGPWSRKVGGLVPIGSPLTLVIAINDHSREFDMRIKRCSATDGKGSEIELTDSNGCVLRTSLLTPFAKVKDLSPKATLVAYSHIHAFKFPDKMDVYVHCIVEVCRHGCPDSCSHQSKGYYHPSGPSNTLESKKHQLLVELAKPIPHTYETKHRIPYHPENPHAYPGKEIIGDSLFAASQTHVHQVIVKNSSSLTTEESQGKKILVNRATFKPKTLSKTTQTTTDTKSDGIGAASNVHGVFTNIGNSLVSEGSKLGVNLVHEVNPPAHATVHRIVGHDIHWIEENNKKVELNHAKDTVPSLEHIYYQPPQPEPATWSADDVIPLTKQEVFLKQQGPNPGPAFFSADEVKNLAKTGELYAPQPEPAAWSADDVKPLTKQEVFNIPQPPIPGPAAWTADDIKPLTKHEIFLPDILTKTKTDYELPHFLSEGIKTTHIPWTNDEELSHILERIKAESEIPRPEPSPWKFDEVNPMHSPEILRLGLHTRQPEEPQPEPTTWTLDEVKPLSKEALRLLSLNHKLKNPHHSLPAYQEFVHPYTTSTVPQPVYIPNYTANPRNMSNGMNMKMMMMSTLLPQTYQTALWPQRPTTRFLRPQRHHYPYPIPQFSNQQQMMMGLIADRRADDEDRASEDLSATHNLGNVERANSGLAHATGAAEDGRPSNVPGDQAITSATEGKVSVGQTYKEAMKDSEMSTSRSSAGTIIRPLSAETPIPSTGNEVKTTVKTDTDSERITKDDSRKENDSNGASPLRPPVAGFVPPTLDLIGTNPETKDRAAHGPRALDRRKRSSEPVFGVQQKFQAIALSDLAFEWNVTAESATVLQGRREEIIYGICMSPATMSAGVGFILIFTLLSIIAAVVFYEHSCLLTKKTSQLSFFTKNFNGRFEALYRITRPYIYSANTNLR